MFKKNSYEQNDCLFNEQTPKQILIDLRKEVAESLIHPFEPEAYFYHHIIEEFQTLSTPPQKEMYLKLLLELASRQKKSCITQKMMDALRNVALPFNLTRLLKQFVYILKAQQVKETLTH